MLAPTAEMKTAISALACVIQIQHRQGQIEVRSTIRGDKAVVLIACNTAELRPRGECFRVIDKNTLKIILEKSGDGENKQGG